MEFKCHLLEGTEKPYPVCIFYSNKAKVGLRAMHFKLRLMSFAGFFPPHSTLIV